MKSYENELERAKEQGCCERGVEMRAGATPTISHPPLLLLPRMKPEPEPHMLTQTHTSVRVCILRLGTCTRCTYAHPKRPSIYAPAARTRRTQMRSSPASSARVSAARARRQLPRESRGKPPELQKYRTAHNSIQLDAGEAAFIAERDLLTRAASFHRSRSSSAFVSPALLPRRLYIATSAASTCR